MTPRDVVHELAAHQSNLTPPLHHARSALIVLPIPSILRALLGAAAATVRAPWIAAWAERLGGGDGAPPTVDLDADDRSLQVLVAELHARGYERLWVLGARDQPGFARELACRWQGELRLDPTVVAPDLEADLATRLYEATGPFMLAGVALAGVDDDSDPHERAARDGSRVFARDRARLAGARHGFLPPAALFGTDRGNQLRARWLRYWSERGHADAVREATLGLDPRLDERLRTASTSPRPPARACTFTITGLDGSGKSSQVAALRDALVTAGRSVQVVKLYRQGAFLELANELGARTRRGAPLAGFRVSRIVKLVDSLRVHRDDVTPALAECDAVLFDRYTETHRAAARSQLEWDLDPHPLLAPFGRTDRTFWLALDAAEALRRLKARGEMLSADEHPVGLAGYAAAFAAMATSPSDVVLDATAPFADNAARIREATLPMLPPTRQRETARPLTQAPSSRGSTRLDVTIGAGPGVTLGVDVADLAGWLRHEVDAQADAVPLGLWIEAYVAQLIIDARTAGAGPGVIPLWPEALRRLPLCADLFVLDELVRLLDDAVQVRGVAPTTAPRLWELFVPSPAARRRIQAEYEVALAAVARERGWPATTSAAALIRVA